jgi:hypothetical protein
MPSPTTSWTGSAAVNGLMAIILLAWLADTAIPSQTPPQREKPAVEEPAPKPPPAAKPVREEPIVVELPPPPRPKVETQAKAAPVTPATPKFVPLRPSTVRDPEPPAKIVALAPRAEVGKAKITPAPKPLHARKEPSPKRQPVKAEPVERRESGPDRKAFADARAEAKARSEARAHTYESAKAEVEVTKRSVRNGRHLLRILEHGEGPAIEIAWPGSRAERERLHGVFRRCYGMRLALIDATGGLYLDEGPRGSRWQVDLDRFSGFVRRPSGQITAAESRDAARVARHHRRLPATDPVRVFPRATDAALLGGIAQALGDEYRAAKAITAAYRLRGSRVAVVGLRVDGRPVAGGIDLSRSAAPACRGAG